MRKKVGIVFRNDENWIGGTYYILNLIHAMHLIEDDSKPEVILICTEEKDFMLVKKETEYPFLSKLIYSVGDINKFKWFGKRKIKAFFRSMDCVFPFPFKDDSAMSGVKRKLYWIGDFQEKYLPEFFSPQALQNRQNINDRIASSGSEVVLSSKMATNDFQRFYPNNSCKTHLLQFAVTHPDLSDLNVAEVLKKHTTSNEYFISPNQFWAHKNHECVIRAVHFLLLQNKEITVLFTGKEYDYRYPEYTNQMKSLVTELKLEKNILFLGFIDRKEQLVLMQQAKAVIQASLFEGWSTVVEDAKCLSKHIILSDLPVHQEQEPISVTWFDPASFESLAEALLNFKVSKDKMDYITRKQIYVSQFRSIVE